MLDKMAEGLLDETEAMFGFDRGKSIALESNRSATYDGQKDGQHFILKIRPFGERRTADYTLGEFEFLEHLRSNGMNVPRAILNSSGNLIKVYDTDQGKYMAYAYEKIEGEILDWRDWSPELFQKYGAMFGKIHAATKSYKPSKEEYRRKEWDDREEWNVDAIPKTQPEILEKARQLKGIFVSLPRDVDSYGVVHEDLHQWNFFVRNGELIPFDFEDCLYDWFVGDFSAPIHNAITGHGYHYRMGQYEYWTNGKKMDAPTFMDYFLTHFMEGYSRENTLADKWLKLIPDFVRRRHLSTYTDNASEFDSPTKSEEEQLARLPWRTIQQHHNQVLDDGWADAIFAKFLARI